MLFNLHFANNTILSCFFFFFLVIDLYFLIAKVFTQIVNPTAEIARRKKQKQKHPVITEIKKVSAQYNSKLYRLFYASYSFISIYYFNEIISCFIYIFQSKFLTYIFFRHDYIFFDTV